MNRWYLTIAPLALVILQAGCTQTPPPAPPDTRAADEQAIRSLEVAWVQAFASKDIDKIASFWANDASGFIPNMPVIKGNAALKAAWKPIIEDKNFMLTFKTASVEVSKSSDLASTQGTYEFGFTDPKSKKAMVQKGMYVEVYKKQADGSWKVVTDISNADAPAAPVK
jgi:uncharacterized protein (TIGR02246 family)